MNMDEMREAPLVEKSKRDLVGERLKKKYPDKEYVDDEALFGQINDDYDQYDNELGQYKERESRLTDLLSKDERAAQFISDMAKGNDPWLAVIERLGIDGITDLLNDPGKQAAYAEANKKYVERLAKEKSLEEEYENNMKEVTLPMLERLKTERGISDDMIDAAWAYLHHVADAAIRGTFTEEDIDMALKAVNHDADVENARTEGTVAGRNAKIDEKLRKPATGDGTPTLSGSNNGPTRRPSSGSMFDLADEAR